MYKLKYIECKKENMEEPLSDRLNSICTFSFNGIKEVCYVIKNMDDASQPFRAWNMVETLSDSDEWNAEVFRVSELPLLEKVIKWIDAVVLVRVQSEEVVFHFMDACKVNEIPIVYDVDDLVFNINYIDEVMQGTNNFSVDFWHREIEDCYGVAKCCNGYITTNDFLKQRIEECFSGNVFVIRNFLNQYQIELAEKYLRKKTNRVLDKNLYIIGYFSGTSTHEADFRMVSDAICNFMNKHMDVVLKIVGYMSIPANMQDLLEKGRIVQKSFMSSDELLHEIAEVDVNIIPIKRNIFTECKSEIKYFEAAAVGTISIMSPAFIYRDVMGKKKQAGYIAEDDEWEKVLEETYHNRTDEVTMQTLYRRAEEDYASQRQLPAIEKVMSQILHRKGNLS